MQAEPTQTVLPVYTDLFRALIARIPLKSFLALILVCKQFRSLIFLNDAFWLQQILASHQEPRWKVLTLRPGKLLKYYLVAYSHADKNYIKVKMYNMFRKNPDGTLVMPEVPPMDIDPVAMQSTLKRIFEKAWLKYRLNLSMSDRNCLKFVGRVMTSENGKVVRTDTIPLVAEFSHVSKGSRDGETDKDKLRKFMSSSGYNRYARDANGKLKIGQINEDRLKQMTERRLAAEGNFLKRSANNNGFLEDDGDDEDLSSSGGLTSSNPPEAVSLRKHSNLHELVFKFELSKDKVLPYWMQVQRNLEVQSFPDRVSEFLIHPIDRMQKTPINMNDPKAAVKAFHVSTKRTDYERTDDKLKTIMFKLHPEIISNDLFQDYSKPLKEFADRYTEFQWAEAIFTIEELFKRFGPGA